MKEKTDLKNEIRIVQLNPKLRLFLFIFCNWLVNLFLFVIFPCFLFIPGLKEQNYVFHIMFYIYLIFLIFYSFFILNIGIKYLPKDFREHYINRNNNQLQKNKKLEISNVTHFFNVTPICDEIYSKYVNFDNRTKEKFVKLSWIETSTNRLVVNGKINNLDFSWGVVTRIKKNNLKIFLLAILYLSLIMGIIFGLFIKIFLNQKPYQMALWGGERLNKYNKLGGGDLFAYHIGRLNSENYLIFAAKLKNQSELITLIPKINGRLFENLDLHYEWPPNLSNVQISELQILLKEMQFLPSIYLYDDNISIVMKKYHYNSQDNQELQTWELIKDQKSNNEIQFNYLNQAIKIYQILDSSNYDDVFKK